MEKHLELFKALSDKTRVRILLLLMEKDLCVCELMFILKMEQSRVSHQLQVLKNVDLVKDEREGKWMIYSISPAEKEMLLTVFDKVIPELKAAAESRLDKKNLRICLEKDIRRTCSVV
ncbi:ArsR family transcriptional regulator [Candidatus Aerophobetes bacterium]|uniref:ArsR family transcriptional regulator n=1 Tax=Aerophobetes bacterium TaxID=2030807 RepID=A0A523TCM7_UNCAE|nr:MAG: ArsR family transcriptional regulator [Candidatus Aerophobetes bacterium]